MAMKYLARVSDSYYISDNQRFLYIKFELVEPTKLSFEAGQYVSLKINEKGERRSYSIASTPDETHGFDLLVEMVPEGKGSAYLARLAIGAQVEVLGPLGRFVVKQESKIKKHLFVATGSGIVPIWSMINDLLINKKLLEPIRLHWGMKHESDLFWLDRLEQLAAAHPNFVYDVVLSRASESWSLCRGHVQDCLARDFPERKLEEWEGYVCGSKEIVMDVCSYLESLGMNKENINHEKFT